MRHLLVLCLLPLPAFAQDGSAALSGPPAAWLGPEPHLVLMGQLAGHPVNIQILDLSAAPDVVAFEGKREYLPGAAGWRFGDFEVSIQAVIDGVEKSFEIEVENDDFARQRPLPASFALGPENFPQGAKAFLEAAAEWETEAGSVNEEIGGWSGTLTLSEDKGTPDAEGLMPDGTIGGHMVAENGADRLVMSFTVPVVEYEKDD
ncbi:hypothetical protein [Rubellimicrobium arenae]|uniref:hypothetical protein n=1 Tax=Rubellimicrobium arenae TaxID=2817372 RepID=UPI001B310F2A|nr:hypothetical protein [Rubellimicrobium arenae]